MTSARGSSALGPIATLVAIGFVPTGPAFAFPLGGAGEVRAVLLAHQEQEEDTRTTDDVVLELARLGDDAVPVLVDLYLGTRREELFGDEDEDDLGRWWCAPDEFPPLFLAALGEMSVKRVVAHLEERTPDDADHEERLTAVRILEELGSADCLDTLFRLGESFGGIGLRYRSVQAPLENAFEVILDDDPIRVSENLVDLVDDASEGIRTVLLTAISRSGRPEYLSALTELLGATPELDIRVLELLPEYVSVAPWRFDERPLELERPYLAHADWRFRRTAVFALGKLRDVESFRAIGMLIDDPQPAVASAARWALANMAGTDQPSTSTEWLDWFDEQSTWWSENHEALFENIVSDEARGAAEAMRMLVARPLYRDQVALEFAELSKMSTRPLLVLASVNALKQLGSKRVVPDLLRLAESRDPSIRTAALAALGRITGAELPPDPSAWREFVEG